MRGLTDTEERKEEREKESHAFRYHPLSPSPLVHPSFIFRSIKCLLPRKLKVQTAPGKPTEARIPLEKFFVTTESPTVKSAPLVLNQEQVTPTPLLPQGTVSAAWTCPCVSQLKRRYWHLVVEARDATTQDSLLTKKKIIQPKMSVVLRLRKPCLSETKIHLVIVASQRKMAQGS